MSDPVKKGMFNHGFFLPILDIVVLFTVAGGTGWYYYSTRGQEQISASAANVAEKQAAYAAEIEEHEQYIVDALEVQRQTIIEKDAKINQAALIERQIQVEHERIQAGRLADDELTDKFVALRRDIEKADDQRRSKQGEILERREEVRQLEEQLAILETELADSSAIRTGIQEDIADLRRERERDPISIFPPGAGLAILAELEDGDQIYGVSLSGVLKEFGQINVGLAGNVGLAQATEGSVKEGGVFVNVPLVFRRASVDFETGVTSMTDARGDDDLSHFLAATLRYAPFYRERFFLLGGLKTRDTDPSVRLGVGFGRR